MTETEKMSLPDGREVDRKGLLLEALKCNDKKPHVYITLAEWMNDAEEITLPNGKNVSKRELQKDSGYF